MKKIIFVLALLILIISTVPCSATEYYDSSLHRVADEAGLLTSEDTRELEAELRELSERYGVDFVVHTAESSDGKEIKHYAADFYDYSGYGCGSGRDGVMLAVVMGTREYYILTTGSCIAMFSDNDIDDIEEEIVPSLSDGDYARAFSDFAFECGFEVDYELNGPTYTVGTAVTSILFCAVVGLIVGFISVSVMKSKLKSVRISYTAADYVDRSSFRITDSRDTFLYKTVTKTEHPKPSESSGSSTFTGSSGTRHGGGGGRF